MTIQTIFANGVNPFINSDCTLDLKSRVFSYVKRNPHSSARDIADAFGLIDNCGVRKAVAVLISQGVVSFTRAAVRGGVTYQFTVTDNTDYMR